MAGEWLKFDKATPEKPEVFAMATELGIDPDAVVGKLMRIWSWFDTHTTDGNATRVTPALLDRIAGVTGFVSSMANCGWISIEEGGCTLPNFSRHCGETAKGRALGAKRTAGFRARNADTVTTASPEKRREEKRREEQKTAHGVDLLDGIPDQVAQDFKQLRTRIRAPITKTAMDGIKREAGKAGITMTAALEMCCERGWRSFKAEWVARDATPNAQAPAPSVAASRPMS